MTSRSIDAIRKAKRFDRLDMEAFDPPDPSAVDPLAAVELASLLRRCDELAGCLTTNERIAFEERVKRQQPAKDPPRRWPASWTSRPRASHSW